MKVILSFLCLALVLTFYNNIKNQHLSSEMKKKIFATNSLSHQGQSLDSLSCQSQSKCLIVYMAPWCPACLQFKSQLFPEFLKTIISKKEEKNIGLKIIIGRDSLDKVQKMGASLGQTYTEDSSGKYYNDLGIKGVPAFLVLRSDGKIIKNVSGFRARGNNLAQASENFFKELVP